MSRGTVRLGCAGWTAVVLVAVAAVLAVVFLWIVPSQRKWYAIDELRIRDTVLSDGSLQTVERFSYRFHGTFTRVYRDIPWDGHAVTVTGVTGPDGRPLKRLPSAWTPAAGPPVTASPGADPTPSPWTSIAPQERPFGYYRVTEAFTTTMGTVTRIEAFADLRDTSADITYRWSAADAAVRWKDTGELEWKVVGGDWTVPMAKVRAVVELPAGASAADVRAWAHGPLNGVITLRPDGTVALAVDDLPPETFVEVHELFPARLLSGAEESIIEMRDRVLADEQHLADEANAARAAARARLRAERIGTWIVWGLAAGVTLIALVIWLTLFLRYGREHRPRTRPRYVREVPGDLSPALVGVLWRMTPPNDADLAATLLDLAADGVVRIEPVGGGGDAPDGGRETGRRDGDRRRRARNAGRPGVRLTLLVEGLDREDDLAAPIVDLLFGEVAKEDSVTVDELQSWAGRHPARFRHAVEKWRQGVEDKARELGFFEKEGGRHMTLAVVATGAAAIVLFVLLTATGRWWLTAPLLCLVALALLSPLMKRRTPEAAELYAQYRGLYRYLRDFGRLQEKPPAAVVLWEKYLVLAVVFGIADKVLAQLRVALPEVVDDVAFRDVVWFATPESVSSFGSATAGFTSLTTGLSAAVIAASPPSSGSGSSSSSSDGGFSGGAD